MRYSKVLYSIFTLITVGLAAPIVGSQASMGQFVVGITTIQAIPRPYRPADSNYTAEKSYLNVAASWGAPGMATIKTGFAPSFFINNERLFLFTNNTHILPVNVLNATVHDTPSLRLAVGHGYKSIQDGSWRWLGTMLSYKLGGRSNRALYYSCIDKDGNASLYTSLEDSLRPPGCTAVILLASNHTWQEDRGKEKNNE